MCYTFNNWQGSRFVYASITANMWVMPDTTKMFRWSNYGSPLRWAHICHIGPFRQGLQAFFLGCLRFLCSLLWNFSNFFVAKLLFFFFTLEWVCLLEFSSSTLPLVSIQKALPWAFTPDPPREWEAHHGGACFLLGLVQANNPELWWRKSGDEGPTYLYYLSMVFKPSALTGNFKIIFVFFTCESHNQKPVGLGAMLTVGYTVLRVQTLEKFCSHYFLFSNNPAS